MYRLSGRIRRMPDIAGILKKKSRASNLKS